MFSFILPSMPTAIIVSPFYAFVQSDFVGKAIVVFLFFGSIYIWTIMIEKWTYLSRIIKASKKFKEAFRKTQGTISNFSSIKEQSPLFDIYKKGKDELLDYYNISQNDFKRYRISTTQHKLTTAQIETIRSKLEQTVSDKILELEDKMGFLATAVSVSPFFGLLGTVWGVMMAFISMAVQGKAEISGMAPGISGALLTTVVGLLVAIPSLIGYNFLSNYIRQLTVYMDNFVEEFMAKLKLEQHNDL